MNEVSTENALKVRHVISTKQFQNLIVLENLFSLASQLQEEDKPETPLAGKTIATLFFEPSTRTRLSFEAAMYKLGGNVISTENAGQSSSATKGESLQDTVRTVASYADAIVLRHPQIGSVELAASISPVPIINAGDGAGEHPTQALLDLYTIKRKFGTIKNLKIALVGDLLYGRTAHSLLILLSMYESVEVFLISPPSLKIPQKYLKGIQVQELEKISDIKTKLDVMYATRLQQERFSDEAQYRSLRESYTIKNDTLKILKKDGILMHPLPKMNEISAEADSDARAIYFEQVRNGVYLRMALLSLVLGSGGI